MIKKSEVEQDTRYITSIEEGRHQAIAIVLEARFNHVPPELVEQLNQIYDHARLKPLLKKASITRSISEFQQELNQDGVE
jgi:DNA-binding transcriptional regulator YbjK